MTIVAPGSLLDQLNNIEPSGGSASFNEQVLQTALLNTIANTNLPDKETPTMLYRVKTGQSFTGAIAGDPIIGILTINTVTNTFVSNTPLWYNGRTKLPLVDADVDTSKLEVIAANSLTSAELAAITLQVGGSLIQVSAEFTRPADTTAYAVNDVVSNSTSATTPLAIPAVFRVAAGTGYIVGVRVATNLKSITPRLRVHFFSTNTATLSVDNAAYQEKYADIGKRLSYVDLDALSTGADTANSDMSRAFNNDIRIPVTAAAASTSLYVVLETLDAFTPASGQKFTVTVSLDNN